MVSMGVSGVSDRAVGSMVFVVSRFTQESGYGLRSASKIAWQHIFSLAHGTLVTRRKIAENDDIATPAQQVLDPVRPDKSRSAGDEDAAGRGQGGGGGCVHGRIL